MKIKRIHTQVAVMSLDHKFSFDKRDHKLEYFPHLCMFAIDNTLIPVSNVREVLVEEDILKPTKLTKEEIAIAEALPEDDVPVRTFPDKGVMVTCFEPIEGRVQDVSSSQEEKGPRPEETITEPKPKVKQIRKAFDPRT